jgi:hypothetical protein
MAQVTGNIRNNAVSGADLLNMLRGSAHDFRDSLGRVCPRLARPPERRPETLYLVSSDGAGLVDIAKDALERGCNVEAVVGLGLADAATQDSLAYLVKEAGCVGRFSLYVGTVPLGNEGLIVNGDPAAKYLAEEAPGHGLFGTTKKAKRQDPDLVRRAFEDLKVEAQLICSPEELLRMPLAEKHPGPRPHDAR